MVTSLERAFRKETRIVSHVLGQWCSTVWHTHWLNPLGSTGPLLVNSTRWSPVTEHKQQSVGWNSTNLSISASNVACVRCFFVDETGEPFGGSLAGAGAYAEAFVGDAKPTVYTGTYGRGRALRLEDSCCTSTTGWSHQVLVYLAMSGSCWP